MTDEPAEIADCSRRLREEKRRRRPEGGEGAGDAERRDQTTITAHPAT
ncbi:hypothetical protein [Methanoculleus frigidifontis]|nr:hypothetical protein [Methanoculleus sp. FWC-SCC1]